MKDKIVIALISGGMALLGVALSQIFELKRRRSEENRWYADYFLPKKFDAISNLYAQLQTTYGVTIYRFRKLNSESEFLEHVTTEVNSFTNKYHLANIYLPSKVNKALDEYKDSILEACVHIRSKIEPPLVITDKDGKDKRVVADWPAELENNYIKAKQELGKILTPKFLKDLEKD